MRKPLIVLAIVCSFAVLLVLADPPFGPPGGSPTPVEVTNFPTDEDGNLLVVAPVANRVIDLLDVDVNVPNSNVFFVSEPFDTGAFTTLIISTAGMMTVGDYSCSPRWQVVDDGPFFQITGIVLGANTNRVSEPLPINGVRAQVACQSNPGSTAGTINDVTVLLRRE